MGLVKIIEIGSGLKEDERGWALFPFQLGVDGLDASRIDWDSLHLVLSRPEAVRGNHIHPDGAEWLFCCQGTTMLYWEEDGVVASAELAGGAFLVFIPAGIPHALINNGRTDSVIMAFRESGGSGKTLERKIVDYLNN